MKIAVLWARYGPYHLARLKGANEVASEYGGEVRGLEVAGGDDVYEWEPIAGGRAYSTVFPDRKYETISSKRLHRGVIRALDASGCSTVAVNGWSAPEARAGIAWRRAASGRRAVLMSETKRDDRHRRWWREWPKRRIVARCDAALVGGRVQADYLCELGFDRTRIFTGYDVVDNDYFTAGTNAARNNATVLRRQYGLPEDYFLACTRFLARKNVDGLLRAYEHYRRECDVPPWGLVIVGNGEQEPRLRRMEYDLNLAGVVWPGFVQYDALPVYYALASAFIHPARSEPWGLVVNEAAASGLPLLVSRTVGARYELVKEGVNGRLFDPADCADMARTMIKVSSIGEEARRLMGDRSRAIVSDWSPKNFGRQLIRAAWLAASLPDR